MHRLGELRSQIALNCHWAHHRFAASRLVWATSRNFTQARGSLTSTSHMPGLKAGRRMQHQVQGMLILHFIFTGSGWMNLAATSGTATNASSGGS